MDTESKFPPYSLGCSESVHTLLLEVGEPRNANQRTLCNDLCKKKFIIELSTRDKFFLVPKSYNVSVVG